MSATPPPPHPTHRRGRTETEATIGTPTDAGGARRRTDRLEIDPDGHALCHDFKTGKTPRRRRRPTCAAEGSPAAVAAQDNADDRTPATPWLPTGHAGHPRCVAASITVLQQPTLTEEQLAELRVRGMAADRIAGPIYRATTKDCEGTSVPPVPRLPRRGAGGLDGILISPTTCPPGQPFGPTAQQAAVIGAPSGPTRSPALVPQDETMAARVVRLVQRTGHPGTDPGLTFTRKAA